MDTIIMTSAAGPEAESQHRVAGVTSHLPHGAVRTADDETVVENFFFKVKHKSASSAIFLIFPIDNYYKRDTCKPVDRTPRTANKLM